MKKLPKLDKNIYKEILILPTLELQKQYLLNNITDVEYTVKNINDEYIFKAAKLRNKIKASKNSIELIKVLTSMVLSSEGMKL